LDPDPNYPNYPKSPDPDPDPDPDPNYPDPNYPDPNYPRFVSIQSSGNQTVRLVTDGDSRLGFVEWTDAHCVPVVLAKYE